MNKTTLIMLIAGLVVGFAGGYGARYFQEKTPPAAPAAHPPMGSQAPGNPAQPMDPQQQAQLEKLHQEIQHTLEEVKARPGDPDPLKKVGNLYYDMKEFQKAAEFYEQAARLDPKDPGLQVDLATSYWYLQQVDKAVEGLTAVLKKDPNHPQALYNMGIIMLHGRNDLKGAKEYWTRLVNTKTEAMDLGQIRQRLEVIDRMLAEQEAAGRAQPQKGQPAAPGMPGK